MYKLQLSDHTVYKNGHYIAGGWWWRIANEVGSCVLQSGPHKIEAIARKDLWYHRELNTVPPYEEEAVFHADSNKRDQRNE